jgi:hypothetical protein
MQTLYIKATDTSPEILLSPQKNSFFIRGNSAPEDVRALYYPLIEWIKIFIDDILEGEYNSFNNENPFKFQVDIFLELKRLIPTGIPVAVEWIYEEGDTDMKEAGTDISLLAGFDFSYIQKNKEV